MRVVLCSISLLFRIIRILTVGFGIDFRRLICCCLVDVSCWILFSIDCLMIGHVVMFDALMLGMIGLLFLLFAAMYYFVH